MFAAEFVRESLGGDGEDDHAMKMTSVVAALKPPMEALDEFGPWFTDSTCLEARGVLMALRGSEWLSRDPGFYQETLIDPNGSKWFLRDPSRS